MIRPTIINILGSPNDILDLQKTFDKALKNIPAVSEDLLGIAWKCMKIALIISTIAWYYRKSLYLSFSNSLQNKQRPITNSCRNNLWSKPILILSKTEFKILRKKPGDEAFRLSFKFPTRDEIRGLPISIDFQI